MPAKYQKHRPHPATVRYITSTEAVELAALQALEEVGREVSADPQARALMVQVYRRVRDAMAAARRPGWEPKAFRCRSR